MAFVVHIPYEVSAKKRLARVPLEYLRHFSREIWIHKCALVAFGNMHIAAKKDGVEILVLSAWRSFEEQKQLFLDGERRHGKGKGILWLAPPGYSEHHSGYVIDIGDGARPETDDELSFESTAAYRWLAKNGDQFGFELSFLRNNWQRVSYEPWHWRFVGDRESKAIFYPPFFRRFANVGMGFLRTLGIV